MEETAIVEFVNYINGKMKEIEIPLNITANDLVRCEVRGDSLLQ